MIYLKLMLLDIYDMYDAKNMLPMNVPITIVKLLDHLSKIFYQDPYLFWHDTYHITLRKYCIDTGAIAFMFNGGSSCGSTIHPIDTRIGLVYLCY